MNDIAVVGAGFSGSLLALHILREDANARVYLIEKAAQFGRGLAYGAAGSEHLLNVRAANMSAFSDEPDHFSCWLRAAHQGDDNTSTFVSRQLYGSYLQTLLGASLRTAHGAGRLIVVGDEAVAVSVDGVRPRLRLALGRDLDADYVVLATGNLPPHDLPCFDGADPVLYASDPWAEDAVDDLRSEDDVLLVGTGLTAIDMVLRLRNRGHVGTIRAVSRRGLRPHPHGNANVSTASWQVPSRPSLPTLLGLVRGAAKTMGWREAIDGLRPSVQRLWRDASLEERQRFLRHLRPWWDIHRHRIAPQVARSIDELVAAGRLSFHAGRIDGASFDESGAVVRWTPRGTSEQRRMNVHRIVNCTGPAGDFAKARSPLLKHLLEQDLARPDACGLGLDVDEDCRIIDIRGRSQMRLFAVGPMSRGAFWEITAVPDIRLQAVQVAQRLAGSPAGARPSKQ